jgi:hypothetical protein
VQLLLWNTGTIAVAVADVGDVPAGVLAGSVALYGALALFGIGLRRVNLTARGPSRRWSRFYSLLLAFLGASVMVGVSLAGALPGG